MVKQDQNSIIAVNIQAGAVGNVGFPNVLLQSINNM